MIATPGVEIQRNGARIYGSFATTNVARTARSIRPSPRLTDTPLPVLPTN